MSVTRCPALQTSPLHVTRFASARACTCEYTEPTRAIVRDAESGEYAPSESSSDFFVFFALPILLLSLVHVSCSSICFSSSLVHLSLPSLMLRLHLLLCPSFLAPLTLPPHLFSISRVFLKKRIAAFSYREANGDETSASSSSPER